MGILAVNGQDNQLAFHVGMTHDRFIDEAYTNNRLKFAGSNFLFSTSWERLNSSDYWNLSFEGSKGKVFNSTTDLEANLIYGQLAVRYGRPVLKSSFQNSNQQSIAALQINSTNYMIEDILDDTWYTGNVTITSNHILSVVFRHSAFLNKKNKLIASMVIPFCGWVKRINYEDGVNQDAEKAWLEGRPFDLLFQGSNFEFYLPWQLLHFRVFYNHPISSITEWMVSYQFRFLRNHEIQPISLYANALTTGFRFYLGKKTK